MRRRWVSEGTLSWFLGCHSLVHSLMVIKAWRQLYGEWPTWRECVCICLHDIGYCGTNYLSDGTNDGHAELGAKIAGRLFGPSYAQLVLGHSRSAAKAHNIEVSKLEAPDDYSWLISPLWWLRFVNKIEGFNNAPEEWVARVKRNWEENGLQNRRSGTELSREFQDR